MEGYADLRIESIRDIEFFILSLTEVDPSQVGFQVEGKGVYVDGKTKTITLKTEVRCVLDYETDAPKLILKYINEIRFYVGNFTEVFVLKEGKYTFDKGFARFLLDLTIPTIRGILFTKTTGTGLNKCYLPLIQSDQMLK